MDDQAPPSEDIEGGAESDLDRQARIAWEAEGIAKARAELDAGFYVDMADVRAWVDSLRTDTPLPLPPIRHA